MCFWLWNRMQVVSSVTQLSTPLPGVTSVTIVLNKFSAHIFNIFRNLNVFSHETCTFTTMISKKYEFLWLLIVLHGCVWAKDNHFNNFSGKKMKIFHCNKKCKTFLLWVYENSTEVITCAQFQVSLTWCYIVYLAFYAVTELTV